MIRFDYFYGKAVDASAVQFIFVLCILFYTTVTQAAPPSPGSVLSPIDKPVYQPSRTQKPEITKPTTSSPAVPESRITVQVDSFQFKGNTTYDSATLQEVVARFEGKKLSIAEIYHVADLVEIYYRYHGFLLTSVYVPAQQINSGNIILEVIEGRLGDVKIQGDLNIYTEAFLIKQANGLRIGEIIDDKTLEKETLLMDDLPGLEARAVIAAGEEYGTSDVVFITEEDRYSGSVSVNNYGRKSIGENRIDAGLLVANPILEGDQLNLSIIAAESNRMLYGRFDYDALINTHGSRVGISYSTFAYEVDTQELGLPDGATLEGSGDTFVLKASHSLQRSTKNNTTILANIRRSETSEDGNFSLRPDTEINLLELFVSWDHLYHDYARTSITGGVITNFKSRTDLFDTTSQKAKATLDVRHYQPFLESWFVIGHLQGTYSPDPLVDIEKFRIGGQGSVRAFPSSELSGDKGGVVSIDVGRNFVISETWVVSPRVFYDNGKVMRIQPIGIPESETLAGYGAGASILYKNVHSIDFEAVKPTTDRISSDGRDARFWLSYRGLF